MGGRRLFAFAMALAVVWIAAPPAQATFHEMSIREVYPGGADNASYIELQMWAGGQNFVGGHHLVAYNPNGSVNEDFAFGSSVANGANQATILVADTSYGSVFPGKPIPDESDANLNLSPGGGAVCWVEGSPPDCVAWGNFTGPLPAHLPALVAGNPASPGGVSPGKALQRSIAPPCSTLLEPSDDSDDSATDFSELTPNPRDNASPIVEKACVAPTATIDSGPGNPTKSTSAAFTYHSTPAGASFECKLDAAVFTACEASGIAYAGPLPEASHTFRVRAKDTNGTGAPASYTWTVDHTPPTASITSHPVDPSPGGTASFRYSSSEGGSSFECRLKPVEASFSACNTQPKVYSELADGAHEFEVRAIDAAGNVQATPTSFPWTVDNSLADTTPPETSIGARPPDPSTSSTATFTYTSTEPDSTFECKLDGSAFAACDPGGVTYSGLGDGQHAFQVRATDASANTDPTPAGYTFNVVLSSPGQPDMAGPAGPVATLPMKVVPRRRHRRHHHHHHHHRRRQGPKR